MVGNGKFKFVATGDSMVAKRISVRKETEFLSVIDIIRNADIAFTNCEAIFHKYHSFPMLTLGFATALSAEPAMAKELKWAGFSLASLTNTHTMDFGPYGMFSTMKVLDELGIVHAGVGRCLDVAGEPKYVEIEKGRVGLIASGADTFLERWQRATNDRGGIVARPGVNMLRLDTHYVVDRETLENLRALKTKLGMTEVVKEKNPKAEELVFASGKFKEGTEIGTYRVPKKEDIERDLLSIGDARRAADWVFLSFHSHCAGKGGQEYPDDFICQYARACIDAGADAFLGHGPHILRGIEIYKGKPIFYSMGNFIAQNSSVKRVTPEQYEFFELSEKARPSDYYAARWGIIPPNEPPYAQWWFESAVAEIFYRQREVCEIKLYPITLGYGEPGTAIGCPMMVKGEKAEEIIAHLNDISRPWNTQIDFRNGVGIVRT